MTDAEISHALALAIERKIAKPASAGNTSRPLTNPLFGSIMAKTNLSAQRVRELLRYDETTGVFTRAICLRGHRVGETCGKLDRLGYRRIKVDGGMYAAHRLAWLYVYGEWPSMDLDHINRVKDDNRISNLRLATKSLNNTNKGMRVTNTSGVTGVTYHKNSDRWVARVQREKRVILRKSFMTLDTAAKAVALAVIGGKA